MTMNTPSPLHVWDSHYASLTRDTPGQYGEATTYLIAAEFLSDCPLVEDWGCGAGGMSRFITPAERYRGIDGSVTPFANTVADLATYEQPTPAAIVMRHILEHNYGWEAVLDNAIRQFHEKMCLILFTPLGTTTRTLFTEPDYNDVPVISFALDDLTAYFGDAMWASTHHTTNTQFGVETVFYLTR